VLCCAVPLCCLVTACQVAAAVAAINALSIDGVDEDGNPQPFSSTEIANAALERHFQVLEVSNKFGKGGSRPNGAHSHLLLFGDRGMELASHRCS
jgi:hypothetical protein